jgi:hypothetical protein
MDEKDRAWSHFLKLLHPDPEKASDKLQNLWWALTSYFRSYRQNRDNAEDLAMETLLRVLRIMRSGKPIEDIWHYTFGVAMKIVKEDNRRPRQPSLDDPATEMLLDQILMRRSLETSRVPISSEHLEQCLVPCLEAFDADHVFRRYHQDLGHHHDARLALAQELGLTLEELRKRISRRRRKLEGCIMKCIKLKEGGMFGQS